MGSAYILLNQASVQNKIREAVLADLRTRLKTDLDIKSLHITPFSDVALEDVYIKDRSGDTALVAQEISAGIDLWALLKKQVVITSIALSDFDVHLSKETKKSPLNIQFIIDAFSSPQKNKKPSPYEVKIDFVNLKQGKATFDIKDQDFTPSKMDFNHLNVNDLNAKMAFKSLKSDSLNIVVKQFGLKEKSGLDIQNLKARLTSSKNHWNIKGFQLNLPSTNIGFKTLSFVIGKGSSFLDKLSFVCEMNPSQIAPKDISSIVPFLRNFKDVLNIQARVTGKVNDLHIETLNLQYGQKMKLIANADIKDVLNKDRMYLLASIDQFFVNKSGIEGLSQNLTANKVNVPDFLNNLGRIEFTGDVSGYLDKLLAFGTLETDLGKLQTEVLLGVMPGKETYVNGKVSTANFKIGKLLANKDLNSVTLGMSVKITKPYNGQSKGTIVGTVYNFDYKGYSYKNINLNGNYNGKKYDGVLSLSDPNIQLNVNGLVDFSQKVPVLNVAVKADHIQLNKLNLYNKDNLSDVSFSMKANFSGNNLDNAVGTLNLDSILIKKADKQLNIKNISIESYNENRSRLLRLRSDFINGEVSGQFSYSSLIKSISKSLDRYMPTLFSSNIMPIKQKNSLSFEFVIGKTNELSSMFNLPFTLYSDSKVFGHYDDQHNQMSVEGYFPSLSAAGQRIESATFSCNNQDKSKIVAKLEGVIFAKNNVANNIAVNLWARNDSIHTDLSFDSNNKQKFQALISTVTHFKREQDSRKLQTMIDVIPGSLILNDSIWHIGKSEVKIASGVVSFDDFNLQNNNEKQSLKINGSYSAKDPNKHLTVDLKDVDLSYIFNMLKIKVLDFIGFTTGEVVASSISGKPYYNCNLKIKDFGFNETPLGDLEIYSELEKETNKVVLKGSITNEMKDVTSVNGFINPLTKELSIDFDAHHINIGFIKKFTSSIFDKVEGVGSGHVRLLGNFSKVTAEGTAVIERATVGVSLLNTSYSFSDTIHLEKDLIYFSNVGFHDDYGNTALCSGKVSHDFFSNMSYDIRFNSKNFLVYNGTEKMNPTFAGKVFAAGDGSIVGDEHAVNLNMQLQTKKDTKLRLNFMNESATQYSFITYKKPEEKIDSSNVKNTNDNDKSNSGMDVFMNFYVSATPDASVELVMDPVSGDAVKCSGSGNIQFEWDLKSEPKIYGNYVINKGNYNFSFQKLMTKHFTIEDGSSIQFRGDPYAANLDINATYKLQSVNLNDLSQTLAQNSGQSNVSVNCLLNISGELRHPTIGLDLALPTVDDEVQRQVKSLLNSEDLMNRQILYLLVLSKFYTPSENTADNSNKTTNLASVASATLSSNLSSVLNQIDPRWQFGTNIRTSNSEMTNTEVELLMSSQLLNNRLLINGNVGYRNTLQTQNAFIGEVDIEYLLTKSGNLRLKAYNHLNEKYYYYANPGATLQTQGVGILYKRDFNSFWDLFSRKKKTIDSKAVRRDTLKPVVPDSAKKGSSLSQFVRIKQ